MSEDVKVAILFGFGINCDRETAAVFELAGATSERVHVNHFVNGGKRSIRIPHSSSSGRILFRRPLRFWKTLGNRMRFAMREQLSAFVSAGKPIIGICNGFQVLVKTGLLPGREVPDFEQRASLTLNNSGRYEDRWVTLEFDPESPCIWTKGITRIECPVRHGEGRFVMPSTTDLDNLNENNQIVTRYVNPNTEPGKGMTDESLPFPICPNGSIRNIAGICDPTGLVFGLMPHPEAAYATFLHPHHTRGEALAMIC